MNLLRAILHDLALVMLVIAGALGCAVLYKALGIESNVTTALVTVNKPKSGTLSMLDDTIFQMRLTIDATNKVLIHEQTQLGTIDGYARNLDAEVAGLASHGTIALDAFGGVATEGKQTLTTLTAHITPVLDSTTTAINTGTDYFQKKQPQFDLLLTHVDDLTVSGNGSVVKFNALLDNPAIPRIEASAADFLGTGAHMLATGDAVETKLAQCTLHPHMSCYVKSDLLFGAQLGGYLLSSVPK